MIIFHDEQIHYEIKERDFFDNRLRGLFEIAVAANLLYKLGNPICCEEISIVIDGFVEQTLICSIEDYLAKTIQSRTSIRHNCTTPIVPVRIIAASSRLQSHSKIIKNSSNACYLLFSEGLDSIVADYLLSKEYSVNKISFPDDYSIVQATNKMYLDTFDNDPWNDYGLYFIFLMLLLDNAVATGIDTISIGLNYDDLNGYDIISNSIIHSQCSQSEEFISLVQLICSYYNVDLILPLAKKTRTEICKIILQNSLDIERSVSCVFFDNVECGMCFSCFDKLSGFLVAIAELNEISSLELQLRDGLYVLTYKNRTLMSFRNDGNRFLSLEQLPVDYILRLQLYRIVSGEDLKTVFSSKYSTINAVKTLYYFSSHIIGSTLFPRASSYYLQCQKIFDEQIMKTLEFYNNAHS